MFRPQPISSTDARKHFTNLIKKVSFSSKSFVIRSYHQPLVRLVNENYIHVLEEVLGKKTVNQIMQIAGNDQLFEAEKMEQIKKIFQRRLSGQPAGRQGPPQQPKPQPQPQPQRKQDKTVVAKLASPEPQSQQSKPPQPKQQENKKSNPTSHPTSNRNRGVLLLSNGKSYE